MAIPTGFSRSERKRNQMAAAKGSTAPSITGTFAPGQVLTAVVGSWPLAGDVLSYQWLLNGSTINGATAATYTVAAGDMGRALSVTITATGKTHGQLRVNLLAKR